MSSKIVTDPTALIALKDDLTKLSNSLHEIYDLMNADMSKVGEAWRDGKYEEFVSGYKPQIDKCEEISQRYADWCHRILEPRIEDLIAAASVDVSGGSGGVSGAAVAGGGAASGGVSKKAEFLKGMDKVNAMDKKHDEVNTAMLKKIADPGADPNERQRVVNPAVMQGIFHGKQR